MNKLLRQSLLLDFYGELLTDHQRTVYDSVINDDISYTELAEVNGISRQGVFEMVKRTTEALEKYEEKLGLVGRFQRAQKSLEQIKECTHLLKSAENAEQREHFIKEIEKLADGMLEDF